VKEGRGGGGVEAGGEGGRGRRGRSRHFEGARDGVLGVIGGVACETGVFF